MNDWEIKREQAIARGRAQRVVNEAARAAVDSESGPNFAKCVRELREALRVFDEIGPVGR